MRRNHGREDGIGATFLHRSRTLDGYAGWKTLSVDYERGSGTSRYEFDVLQQGPRASA